MAIQAELKAKSKLDNRQFKSGVKGMGNQVQGFKKQLAPLKGMIVGAFSVGAIVAFGRQMLKTADDLQTAANVFGMSMESVLTFKNVMASTGIGAERFNKIFGRIATAQGDAGRGLKTYTDALEDMGVEVNAFASLSPDKALLLLAKSYERAGDKNKYLQGMTKLLGTRLVELVEVFQRLNRGGLAKYAEGTKEAAEGMKRLAEASDRMEKIGNDLTINTAKYVGKLKKFYETILEIGYVAEHLGKTTKKSWWEYTPPGWVVGKVIDYKDALNAVTEAQERAAKGEGKKHEKTGKDSTQEIADLEEEAKRREELQEKEKNAEKIRAELIKKAANDRYQELSLMEKIAHEQEHLNELQKTHATISPKAEPEEFAKSQTKLYDTEKKISDLRSERAEQQGALINQEGALQKHLQETIAKIETSTLAPEMARVGALQQMGGIVGGVAGGDYQARKEARQEKIQERTQQATEAMQQEISVIRAQLEALQDIGVTT